MRTREKNLAAMKKLKLSGKSKERETKQPAAPPRESALLMSGKAKEEGKGKDVQPPKELFWDDYSDLGYC
jgi:hypothetical protein